jgi:Aromatic-ring-opening dioxygenase LigAB, LigA subunit
MTLPYGRMLSAEKKNERAAEDFQMSLYALQKLLRDVNRNPQARKTYFAAPEAFSENYELTEEERQALLSMNVTSLYRFGVHGLILRPFTMLHKMPENEYLERIRREA